MLYTLKNSEGYIYAYMEFDIVDNNGKWKNEGNHLYIRDLFVHNNYDGEEVIKEFILKLDNDIRTKYVEKIYWEREVNGQMRVSKAFPREICLRRIKSLIMA